MKLEYLGEVTPAATKKKERKIKKKETYGLEFVPNQETLDALDEVEAMSRGEIDSKVYHSFEEMWSDICGT